MLTRFLGRGWVMVMMLVIGFALTAFTPNQSQARKRHSSRTTGRKTSHSALHRAKRHSKFSARSHRSNLHPLSTAEKAEIIGKIKSMASAEALPQESVTEDDMSADDIAQAAKEEREEDNIQVSLDDFIKSHNQDLLASSEDPAIARDRQSDYTLFDESNPGVAATRSDVMQQIIDWVGTRYHFGGVGRTGIDCSAFTREVFRKAFNVELPRTASEQSGLGEDVRKNELHFGDLVFFHTARHARVSHVGIYVGEGLFANASCSRGVTVCSLQSEYWSKHYLFAKRLFTNTATAQREITEKLRLAANAAPEATDEAN